jgi:hypothetical protein
MKKLTDVDLHLFLAKTMPWRHRIFLRGFLLFDPNLRNRLHTLKLEVEAYRQVEQNQLKVKLFGSPIHTSRTKIADVRRNAFSHGRRFWEFVESHRSGQGMALAMATLVLSVVVLPWLGGQKEIEFTAKGDAFALKLFVKGDSLRAINEDRLLVSSHDTLQFMPLGAAKPFLAVYGWDAEQGLVRLFPATGDQARQVTVKDPPPGLVLAGGGENRLFCITHGRTFSVDSTLSELEKLGLTQSLTPTISPMPPGWKMQVFTVRDKL